MTDRLTGLLFAALAVWYGYTAQFYTRAFADPLGPSTFPEVLAVPFGLLALYLVVRPDPDPEWVLGRRLAKQVGTIASLIGYALLIKPLGFVVTTAILGFLLSMLLGAKLLPAIIFGLISGFGFFLLFDYVFQLPLPSGVLFGG